MKMHPSVHHMTYVKKMVQVELVTAALRSSTVRTHDRPRHHQHRAALPNTPVSTPECLQTPRARIDLEMNPGVRYQAP